MERTERISSKNTEDISEPGENTGTKSGSENQDQKIRIGKSGSENQDQNQKRKVQGLAKKQGYSFEEKKHSGNGITATVLGGISLMLMFCLLGLSFVTKGDAAYWSGAVGILGIAMAVCGLSYGYSSFQDECKYTVFSKAGTAISLIAVVGWFFIVCIGIAA